MNKIRVKTIFGAHQIYQEIVNYPPQNVDYVNVSKQTVQGRYYQNKKWKEYINKITQFIRMPRMILVMPGEFDIIHTSRGIIPIQPFSNKPWVMDVEYFTSFTGLDYDTLMGNKILRKFIENRLSSKNCKKIICHCEATRQSFIKHFNCKGFEDKLSVIYPSSHLINATKKKSKNITLLAVLSLFEQKGGEFVLDSFQRLRKKYPNLQLILKADVPEKVKNKYSFKNVKVIPYKGQIVPREDLLKTIYVNADIFLYPSFCDSFGYSLIDAMVAGLPIISTNLFAFPEVVVNNKLGLTVDIPGYRLEDDYKQDFKVEKLNKNAREKFIQSLTESIEKLVSNTNLRKSLSSASFDAIKAGKFSLKVRNQMLLETYKEALK